MISINLHQPGRLDLTIQFPSGWDELLPEEVMEISRQQIKEGNTQEAARAAILKFIISLRTKLSKQKLPPQWMNLIDAEQAVINGYPLLDFIYNENELTRVPEQKIMCFYGPADAFEELTCGEFEDTEIEFNKFYTEPDIIPLAKLAAILWRPSSIPLCRSRRVSYITWQHKTATYKTYDANKPAKHFLKISPERLYAIFTWYVGCRSQLPKLFPTVHEGGEKKNEMDLHAFTKCIHAGAGPKNGSRQTIRLMKVFEFFFDMEEEAIKAKEQEKIYNEQSRQT
jgi:hypothetical protein